MAYSLITNAKAIGGTNTATTGSLTTTGATLLVAFYTDFSDAAVLTDSKSNTWTHRATATVNSMRVKLYDCIGGTVGSGHTFDVTGASSFPTICVSAWSETSPAFDQSDTSTEVVLSEVTVGPLTPPQDGALFITGWANDVGDEAFLSINQSFTILNGAASATADAYFIQTTAAAKGPTWDGTSNTNYAGILATYIAGSGNIALSMPAGAMTLTGYAPTIGGVDANASLLGCDLVTPIILGRLIQ
jgi:hypothetical protein